MKITRANVEQYAKEKGLEPIQIDGILEGLSFKEPDIEINGINHEGYYIVFIPLQEWDYGVIRQKSLWNIYDKYFNFIRIR